MSDSFDPYYEWLGIGPEERPVNHYRLLGLSVGEADRKRISNAADQRVAYLRGLQQGRRAAMSQQLLNEVAAAASCLLDPNAKEAYDASLSFAGPPEALPVSPAIADNSAPVPIAGLAGPMAPVKLPSASAPVKSPPVSDSPLAMPAASGADPAAPPRGGEGDHEGGDEHIDGETEPISRLILPAAIVAVLALFASLVLGVGGWLGWIGKQPPPIAEEADPPSDTPTESESPQAVVVQEGDGGLRFSPSFALFEGDVTLVEADGNSVTSGWNTTDQAVLWKARLIKPSIFAAKIEYASASEQPAGRLSVAVDGDTQEVSLRGSGGSDQFVTETFFLAIRRSGVAEIVLRPKEIGPDGFIRLRSLELTPR